MTAPSQRRLIRTIAGLLGLLLLLGAIVVVAIRFSEVRGALTTIDGSRIPMLAALVGLVALNVVSTGFFFHRLLTRFGNVGVVEMQAVMAAATLLNYLPLRPGLFGRLGYHARVNGISLRDGTRTVVESIIMSAVLAMWFALSVVLGLQVHRPLLWLAVAPGVLLIAMAGLHVGRGLAMPALIRWFEIGLAAARTAAAFAVLGVTLTLDAALALASISVVVSMVPFSSNGLGLREWVVGLLAPTLVDVPMEVAMTAELVHRAAELIVVAPAGLIGVAYVRRRLPGAGS